MTFFLPWHHWTSRSSVMLRSRLEGKCRLGYVQSAPCCELWGHTESRTFSCKWEYSENSSKGRGSWQQQQHHPCREKNVMSWRRGSCLRKPWPKCCDHRGSQASVWNVLGCCWLFSSLCCLPWPDAHPDQTAPRGAERKEGCSRGTKSIPSHSCPLLSCRWYQQRSHLCAQCAKSAWVPLSAHAGRLSSGREGALAVRDKSSTHAPRTPGP